MKTQTIIIIISIFLFSGINLAMAINELKIINPHTHFAVLRASTFKFNQLYSISTTNLDDNNIFSAIPVEKMVDNTSSQKRVLNIIAFGGHPDDCDNEMGGTAIKFAKMGHNVKFVAVCNGNKGHYKIQPEELAKIRKAESMEAGRRFGVEYQVLDYPDCDFAPDLEARHKIIRLIREWNADIVISHRPNDYHSDHRYTAQIVQDAAYNVLVPHDVPDVPALKENPVFLYFQDNFKKPLPFSPDIVVDITEVIDQKIHAMMAHESQYFDWLPWTNGILETVPKGEKERHSWLLEQRGPRPGYNKKIENGETKYFEQFEICEYGKQPTEEEIAQLFPMINE